MTTAAGLAEEWPLRRFLADAMGPGPIVGADSTVQLWPEAPNWRTDMTRTELFEAAEVLREAADAVDDDAVSDRIGEQADQIASLAERDRGPDHGRLDRHQQALRDLGNQPAVDGNAADRLEEAIELITAYRRDLPGV